MVPLDQPPCEIDGMRHLTPSTTAFRDQDAGALAGRLGRQPGLRRSRTGPPLTGAPGVRAEAGSGLREHLSQSAGVVCEMPSSGGTPPAVRDRSWVPAVIACRPPRRDHCRVRRPTSQNLRAIASCSRAESECHQRGVLHP